MVENQQLNIPCISSTVAKENWSHSMKIGLCSARGLEYYCLWIDEHSISNVPLLEANYEQSIYRAACTSPGITGKQHCRLSVDDARVYLSVTQSSTCQRSTRMASESTAATVTIRLWAPRGCVTAASTYCRSRCVNVPSFPLLLPVIIRYWWIATHTRYYDASTRRQHDHIWA